MSDFWKGFCDQLHLMFTFTAVDCENLGHILATLVGVGTVLLVGFALLFAVLGIVSRLFNLFNH